MGKTVLPQVGNRPDYSNGPFAPVQTPCIEINPGLWSFLGDKRWWKMCGKKIAYFDKEHAELAAWKLARSYRRRGFVFRAYHCRWCEWWHLGHTKQ